MCAASPPPPLIILVARRPLGRNKGGGESNLDSQTSQTFPHLPTGNLPYLGFSIPTWRRIPSPWCAPTSLAGQRSLGGLTPRIGAWGSEWYCPETSRTFQKLPGPSRIVSGHSGTFWSTYRTFRDRSRTFRSHPDSFQDQPSYGLSHPMTVKIVWTPNNYPETIPVDPALPQYHSHMFRNHLGLLQSDPYISLNTQNYFWCPYEQFHKYPELLPVL